MNTQLMTLDQAIEKRIAEIRQAEAERKRQEEEAIRRREDATQRALEWLCSHLRENEGIAIEPGDFARASMDGNGVVHVTYGVNGGRVELESGIQFSSISNRFEIVQAAGRRWRGTQGCLYSNHDSFVDAVIYAGGLKS